MAKQDTFFDRIQRLFSTGVIVRNVGGKKLKVVDTDDIQAGSRTLMDRYQRLYSGKRGIGSMHGYGGELAKAQRMSKSQKTSAVKRKRAKAQGVGGRPTFVSTFKKKKKKT